MSNDPFGRHPDHDAPGSDVPGGPALNRAATVATSAVLGGAVSGALVGTVAGPVGTAIGAAVGAIAAGFGGNAIAASVDSDAENAHWRNNFHDRPYVNSKADFEHYGPAYAHGVHGFVEHAGRSYDDIETDLEKEWPTARGTSALDWSDARHASRDAWNRVHGNNPNQSER